MLVARTARNLGTVKKCQNRIYYPWERDVQVAWLPGAHNVTGTTKQKEWERQRLWGCANLGYRHCCIGQYLIFRYFTTLQLLCDLPGVWTRLLNYNVRHLIVLIKTYSALDITVGGLYVLQECMDLKRCHFHPHRDFLWRTRERKDGWRI
jgi:hypothetical protein